MEGLPGAGVGVESGLDCGVPPAGVLAGLLVDEELVEVGLSVGVLGVLSRFPKILSWAPSVKPHSLKETSETCSSLLRLRAYSR